MRTCWIRWRAQASVVAAWVRHCRVKLSVLGERVECWHGGVIGGGEQVVHELVPVAVGIEHERDELCAFLLSKERVLVLLRVDCGGFGLVHVGAGRQWG